LAAATFGLRSFRIDRNAIAATMLQVEATGYDADSVLTPSIVRNSPIKAKTLEARIHYCKVIELRSAVTLIESIPRIWSHGAKQSMGQGETPNSLPVRQAGELCTPNSKGFTVIELIVVIVIIGILAATVLPNINFGTTSSTVSAWGAAYIIASDIRYTQECAMASMVSKGISFTSANFTSGQIVYTFPATTPSTSSLDPTGQLPSAVTIGTPNGTPFTFTFNSLGEPEETTNNSVTVTAGGITRTITVTQYTGMVTIS
jgi:prepilin-type N-terminal cleavage/methylation domain-containing protein